MLFPPVVALAALLVVPLIGCAPEMALCPSAENPPAPTASVAAVAPSPGPPSESGKIRRQEEIRTGCIAGRRLICGRVLKVLPDGLVIDSGYTGLLRPPLTQSWVVPGDVSVHRDPNVLELNEPGTPCIGLAFLTDVSKRRQVKQFDYIILMGYPAGKYVYSPAPSVKKTIRKFAAGLETAVRLTDQAETNDASPTGTDPARRSG
jgi:hypothetical protein